MKSENKPSAVNRALQGLVFALALLPLVVVAKEDTSDKARELINEMSRASRNLNYDGIFVYRRGSRMDTMRLIHRAGQDGEMERMVSLTGHAREVIRDGEKVTCIFPDNRQVMVEKTRPRKFLAAKLPEPIEQVAEYYDFSVAGKDRVAGRPAWVVNIVPKDDYRYGYQLWIDAENHLLLKSELKDDSGWPLEQILFTRLEVLDHISEQLLEPSISGKGYTWYSNSAREIPAHGGDDGWKVTWMPKGFSMSDYEKKALARSNMPVEHMIYTDGLAIVSVFVEKLGDNQDIMEGPSRMGGVNAFATMSNGYQLTAVGEVPEETVRKMATSIVQAR